MLRDILMLVLLLVVGILLEKRIRNVELRFGGDKESESKNKETDRKIEALRDAVSKLNAKLEELQKSNEGLRVELQQTKTDLKSALKSEGEVKVKLSAVENDLQKALEYDNTVTAKLSTLESDLSTVLNSNENLKSSISELDKVQHLCPYTTISDNHVFHEFTGYDGFYHLNSVYASKCMFYFDGRSETKGFMKCEKFKKCKGITMVIDNLHVTAGLKDSEQQRVQQQSKIDALTKELQESTAKTSESNGQIKALANGLQQSKNANEELKGQITRLESSLENVKNTDKSLEAKVNNLDKEFGTVKSNGDATNAKMTTLQKELTEVNNARNELQSKLETLNKGKQVVAFHAVGTEQSQLGDSEVLKYSKAITNIGNGYDKGYFVAPVKGLYLLSMSAMSPKGKKLRVEMVKNGDHIADVLSGSTGEEMGSQTATVVLQAGDKAWVRHHPSQKEKEHLHPDTFNSFSGLLISTEV